MKIITAEQMREIDRQAIEDYAIPGIMLMENAGIKVFEAALEMLSSLSSAARVVVACGRGNNGGDGFVLARHLARAGIPVQVWALARGEEYRGDAAVNYKILMNTGFPIQHILDQRDLQDFESALDRADLVIDALLGTGTRREVKGIFAAAIERINGSGKPVLAVDIPSGVDADTGDILGVAVRACRTVTFALPKRGFYLFPGAACTGEVNIADIGIPEPLVQDERLPLNLVTEQFVGEQLPSRPLDGHKGTFGRALVVAGSPGMTGAAALAADAALRGGTGLVYAATAASLRPVLEGKLVEAIACGLPELPENQLISRRAAVPILEKLANCSALAVGPGMDPGEETFALLQEILPAAPVPVVIDAGALAALSRNPSLLRSALFTPVITPHPGEMALLCQLSSREIQERRLEIACRKAAEWNAVVVLKGAYSVVALPGGSAYINQAANPVLATAGSGDLLTGLILAQLAQGQDPAVAAICGTYIHGRAGELAAGHWGDRGVTAAQISSYIPKVFRRLRQH